LKIAGKGDERVALVFAKTEEDCHRAAEHLRAGAPDVPVWIFSTAPPRPETEQLCERVVVRATPFRLLLAAEKHSWRRWVAISVAPWTRARDGWPIKLAPFLIPPFRALLLNEHGDFIPGSPGAVALHARRRWRDRSAKLWNDARDFQHRTRDAIRLAGRIVRLRVVHAVAYSGASLIRRWFPKLHGNEALAIDAPLPGPDPVDWLVVRNTGPEWNGATLARAANDGDTRCVLWGAGEPTAAMLALFDDPRTFAVGRQMHVRGWKKLLFPTAPFRTLQPGEAAQVIAPLSDTVLVDRVKLLELGIPPARLSGTAWMLLFWRAAAAGWRSYGVGAPFGSPSGSGQDLLEQSDFPVEEVTFFWRALRDRELLRLRPREPALGRGAVAFRPGAALEKRDRPRVLVLSPFLPYPLSHGGAVRIWNLCRALSDRVDFVLIAAREHGETVHYAKLAEIFRDVRVVDIDERALEDETLPRQVRHHHSASLRAVIAEMARQWEPHVLQIEYTHMAHFRDAATHVPAILVEHDVTFTLYRQLADTLPGAEAEAEFARWFAFEQQWLKAYDAVWTVSEQDRELVARESGKAAHKIHCVPNGVDVERYRPEAAADTAEILYVGSFRHLPNVIGFEKLEGEVMPLVWRRFPEARLRVVAGPRHEAFWQKRDIDPRIEIHGFVEDLRPLYARAAVVAAPLEVSAGTNIKVLEAMACGRAVVTTPVGCAGLDLRDGVDVLIRAGSAAFADGICDLLADRGLHDRVGAGARASAELRFSWTAIAGRAYESYCAVNVAVTTLPGSV
jgi:glycosyltransferase involved in cell wall biosynthesis